MAYKYFLLVLIIFFLQGYTNAQTAGSAINIYDAHTMSPLPFAIVKYGNGVHGGVANLDGKFIFPGDLNKQTSIAVSYLGYVPITFVLPHDDTTIYLQPDMHSLSEVVIKSPADKIHRIINATIANKAVNNPDNYNWYQCHIYYKTMVNATLPDSTMKRLAETRKDINSFLEEHYLFMSETYSLRTWRAPQLLQEDILATRFSGLKKSVFTSLVTDILPFHAYTDYITLNAKDYHNPISRGYENYYKFTLDDEVTEGADTVWVLGFNPRTHNTNELSGTVYISSAGYAISRIIAKASDTILKRTVCIEQQYDQIPTSAGKKRWFPGHLNYIIDWDWQAKKKNFAIHMKGTSRIDSVTFNEKKDFRFDKVHTIRMAPHADERSDSAWAKICAAPLDEKEKRTYRVIDSLGEKANMDQKISFISKLPEGKVPIGIFDFDLLRLFSANYYENYRLGMGIQTNERLVRWLSVGGWAGYGFGDAHWKYGAFADLYADRYKEFVFRVGYTDDISDPGRVHINPDIDKNYLGTYLLQKVDEVKAFTVSVKKKFGYLGLDLSGTQEQIIPKYNYALLYENSDLTTFTATEISLHLRYAYAERTAPFFSHYNSIGSRYPVLYGKLTNGVTESGNMHTPYTQAILAGLWHKHINRIGLEHMLLEGGKSWSNGNLPLGKLFAGNGFDYTTQSVIPDGLYTFGGMMTIFPYQFYTDQYINFVYRHDFDWKLYKYALPGRKLSSAPNICLQYDMLYGTLQHPQVQRYVNFSVPDNAYHEAGVLLNNFIRLNYLNSYYFTFNIGYFYHLTNVNTNNGRIVFSVGYEF